MRTVNPEIWSRKLKKPKIQVTRTNRFGQQPAHKYERIFRESFADAAHEFWENCSVPGVKYINMEGICRLERYCYILLLFLTLGLAIFVVTYISFKFHMRPPLVINSVSSTLFMTDVSFPAVALCSNAIVSRVGIENLTDFLFNHPSNQNKDIPYLWSEIKLNLSELGGLVMLTVPPAELNFGEFLRSVYSSINITDLMIKLAQPCALMLHRCSWRGRLVPCDSLFAHRVTPLGFCCVFNSRYYPDDANNEPQVLDMVGQNYGLGIVIGERKDDFVYMRRNTYGSEMLLFEGSEYPLLESGDVRLYPIPNNVAMYVNVRAKVQKYNTDVKYYREEWRGCRTNGPGQSWCLSNCRRDTVGDLCGCVPFTLDAGLYNDSRRVCGVRDLPCLNKHREKLMYLYPTNNEHDPHLSEERQDGLSCRQCRVLCRRQVYSATISYSHYADKTNLHRNYLTKGLRFKNASIVHIFYSSDQHDIYTVEEYLPWYEGFAKVSTQWAVLAGASSLAAVELVYHIAFRWPHHFIRRYKLVSLQPAATSM